MDDMDTLLRRLRNRIRGLQKDALPVGELRDCCVRDSGRLSDHGKALLDWANERPISQAALARLLGVSPSAVSNYYNR